MTKEKDLTSKGKSPLIQGFQRAVKVETLPDETTMRDYNTGMQKVHSEVDKAVSSHIFATHVFVEEATNFWNVSCEEFLQSHVVEVFGSDAIFQTEICYEYFSKSTHAGKDGIIRPLIVEAIISLKKIPYYRLFLYAEDGTLVFEALPHPSISSLN